MTCETRHRNVTTFERLEALCQRHGERLGHLRLGAIEIVNLLPRIVRSLIARVAGRSDDGNHRSAKCADEA
jgi:hypothetical protein